MRPQPSTDPCPAHAALPAHSLAPQVAAQLRDAGWLPQVVVCSNARRTRQTLDAMQVGEGGWGHLRCRLQLLTRQPAS